MHKILPFLFLAFANVAFAQSKEKPAEKGKISGNAQLVYNFFDRDTTIGAANNPLYDKLLSGGASWVNLNYTQGDFEVGGRIDVFLNSNIHQPQTPYNEQGIGFFYIKKQIDKLRLVGGNFYEQFGSGIPLRAYEDRSLGIDNSLFGLSARYDLNDRWAVKAIAGVQKNLFKFYAPTIKGFNIEGSIGIKDSAKGREVLTFIPGASIVNRTLDQNTMNGIVTTINALPLEQRFVPMYNTFVFQGYNTIQYKNISLYTEYNQKTHEAINNLSGNLIDRAGSVAFGTLGYSQKGFGITAQYKRTENFSLRTSPGETLLRGMVAFLPPVSRQNSMRLPARYVAASQEISEQSAQLDIIYSPKDELTFNTNIANMTDLNGNQLFREIYQDVTINKGKNEWQAGVQFVDYNIDFFQGKPGAPQVRTFTPFVEYTRRLSRKQSLRFECQYMVTDRDHQIFSFLNKDAANRPMEKQDFGDWMFLLAEFNIAPHWSFAVSDMYNIKSNKPELAAHYPTFFTSYTRKNNRFTAAYAKQVEGVVCTGGVCRFEPAFSGVRVGMTTSF
jgi:Family of unknown function (DUF6029)